MTLPYRRLRHVNCFAGQHGLVAVQLGDQLQRRVHAQHGHACIHGDDVPVCHISRYSAAAALIHLAQGRDLPQDTGIVQCGTDVAHGLGGGVGSTALAPGAGVLAHGHAVIQQGIVPAVAGLGEIGVKGISTWKLARVSITLSFISFL